MRFLRQRIGRPLSKFVQVGYFFSTVLFFDSYFELQGFAFIFNCNMRFEENGESGASVFGGCASVVFGQSAIDISGDAAVEAVVGTA